MLFKYEMRNNARKVYPWVVLVSMIVIVYLYHFVIYDMYQRANLNAIMNTQRFAMIGFVYVTFMSIDIFSDLGKRDWIDSVITTKYGLKSIILNRIKILLLNEVIWFGSIVFIDCFLIWPIITMPVEILINVLRAVFLNFFLFPSVGIFMGLALGSFKRRFLRYMLGGIFVVLSIGVLKNINVALYELYNGEINLEVVSRIFTLTQPNMIWQVSELYLIPVESYRVFLYLGWIIFFIGLFLWMTEKKKRSILVFAFCIICVLNVIFPGNISNNDTNENNVANDVFSFRNADNSLNENIEDFVEEYIISLNVGKQLNAVVEIQVDSNRKEYNFTLYNGYKLLSIIDQNGNDLNYTREGDYITIDSPEANTSTIIMRYRGYSGTFFSNSTLTVLPGFFPWYPQAGIRPIYKEEVVDNYYYYGYNKDVSAYKETDFTINCTGSKYPFFSNLDGKNQFSGKAKCATIISGAFNEDVQNGITLLYPRFTNNDCYNNYIDIYKESLEHYQEYLNINIAGEQMCDMFVFLNDAFSMSDIDGTGFWLEDHFIQTGMTPPDETALDIVRIQMNVLGDKKILREALLEKMNGLEFGRVISEEDFLNWEEESIATESPIRNMYITLVEKYGLEIVNASIIEYLQGYDNELTCVDFLKQLYLDLEDNVIYENTKFISTN